MFSQSLSEFTNFASKISSELSLDNLQNEEQKNSGQQGVGVSTGVASHKDEDQSERIKDLENTVADLRESLVSEKESFERCNSELERTKLKLREEIENSISLKQCIEDKEGIIADMTLTASNMQSKNADLQSEVEQLRNALSATCNIPTDGQDTTSLNGVCDTCEGLRTQLESVRQAYASLQHTCSLSEGREATSVLELKEGLAQIQEKGGTEVLTLAEARAEVKSSSEASDFLTKQLAERTQELEVVRSELSTSTAAYAELKEKQITLSGKMKEKIKHFMDKHAQLEEHKRQLMESLKEKDSEVTSLRLKLDAIENNLSDRKALSSELSERYSEVQRDLQRKQEEIDSLLAAQENSVRQLMEKEQEAQNKSKEVEDLRVRLRETMEEVQREAERAQERCDIAERESHAAAERRVTEMACALEENRALLDGERTKVRDLEEQITCMQEKSMEIRSSAQSLEDYKSRAQKALKQANATSATLTNRVSSLENALGEAEEKLKEAENHIMELIEERGSLQQQIKDVSAKLKEEKEMHRTAVELLEQANKDISSEVIRMKDAILAMEEEKARTLAAEKQHTLEVPDDSPRFTLSPRTPPSSTDSDLEKISIRRPTHPNSELRDEVHAVCGSDDEIPDNTRSDSDSMVLISQNDRRGIRKHETGDEDDTVSLSDGPSSNDLFLIKQYKATVKDLHREIAQCHADMEHLRHSLQAEQENKARVVQQLDELNAFHERTKRLLNSPDSAVNIEYLKKCVYRLMITKELSEKKRLYPVISVILKFTPQESTHVTKAIDEEISASTASVVDSTWVSISDMASSSIGGLFRG
mmetsp:Transcript_21575/g.31377  ORF Transcript_21575/g.31377 Transcript_21575/m.31377 type:complete len:821 (-) Transcript_21575:125-2587(-)|eukprot:CAMPEP_0185033340 /NCGR_PEP_ID=MMETSP1103-20130426/22161_1 /TAXON_ID=36769 /ORGANISM="Paraphysomonas bandaiensis, Strain Caron Lab Isolate" /LENGTH=820 /DNA_ID=CAMNT_0027569565 /DNA_START=77 /DNA_END=2539 /DNA_ORIENTATION=+